MRATGHVEANLSPVPIPLRIGRPENHNALSPDTMDGIVGALNTLGDSTDLRGVFLKANGKSFCAGGDLKHMRATADFTADENRADAMRLSGVFDAINNFPRPVVAMVGGNVFGGGLGILSACDMVFAVTGTKFAFTEVKLGVIPATIAPYVLARIGASAARRYFLTAEAFGSAEAMRIGLVNSEVADVAGLDEIEAKLKAQMLLNSPAAVEACKQLIHEVGGARIPLAVREFTAQLLAETRDSPDGREGMSAFNERRKPRWQEDV
jgi:methylglutaconyl-CoA hydratase